MNRPSVSVIIPVHDGAEYLTEALESVMAQTYQPLEVLVIDDGSKDASLAIARRFEPRVRCHVQPQRGTAAARNEGVRLARGELLAFLDQDDVWLADKLAFQVELLCAEIWRDGVFGWVEQFANSESWRMPLAEPPRNGCLPSALLVRRAAFFAVGMFDARWLVGEWADWYVRAAEAGLDLAYPPRLVARRRIHAHNKGRCYAQHRIEYVRILKASLDRRRAPGPATGALERPAAR